MFNSVYDFKDVYGWSVIAAMVSCLVVGFMIGKSFGVFTMQQQALSNGAGYYDSETAKFKFLNFK